MRRLAWLGLGFALLGCPGVELDPTLDAQVDTDAEVDLDAELRQDGGATCTQICVDHLEAQRLRVESELRGRTRSPATCVTPSTVVLDCTADCEAGADLNQYSFPAVEECWSGTERPARVCEGALILAAGSISRNGQQPNGNGFVFTGTAAVSATTMYSFSITSGAGDTYGIDSTDYSLAGLSVGQVVQAALRSSCHFWCSAHVELYEPGGALLYAQWAQTTPQRMVSLSTSDCVSRAADGGLVIEQTLLLPDGTRLPNGESKDLDGYRYVNSFSTLYFAVYVTDGPRGSTFGHIVRLAQ